MDVDPVYTVLYRRLERIIYEDSWYTDGKTFRGKRCILNTTKTSKSKICFIKILNK